MLRNKIIQAFVAVWCAVCLSYVGVRTALGVLLGGSGTGTGEESAAPLTEPGTGEPWTGVDTSDQLETQAPPQASQDLGADETTSSVESDEPAEPTSVDFTLPDEPVAQGSPETIEPQVLEEPMTTVQPDSVPDVTVESGDADSTGEEGSEWTDNRGAGQDVWLEETSAQDVPSLYEYLSGFTCGSCRRNCSLANPRCHNGSRLADAKTQEYYSVYGL